MGGVHHSRESYVQRKKIWRPLSVFILRQVALLQRKCRGPSSHEHSFRSRKVGVLLLSQSPFYFIFFSSQKLRLFLFFAVYAL